MDCRNTPDFSDDNTILYGHNRKDGSMFGSFGMSLEGEVTVQVYTPQGLNTYQAVDNRIIGASEEPYYRIQFREGTVCDIKQRGFCSYRDSLA